MAADPGLWGGCIVAVTLALVPWFGALPARRWWAIGGFWLGLTLAFEFGFGRFVQQRSWAELLAAYGFRDGNLWPLVLLVSVLAPVSAARLRTRVLRA